VFVLKFASRALERAEVGEKRFTNPNTFFPFAKCRRTQVKFVIKILAKYKFHGFKGNVSFFLNLKGEEEFCVLGGALKRPNGLC